MGRRPLPPEQRKPKLTGAQRARLKKAKLEEDDIARGVSPPPPSAAAEADESWAEVFEDAGEPDLENPDTDLAYVRKLQLICLRQMATTANPSKLQQAAWKRIREAAAIVGMTSNRAKLEADLRMVKAALKSHQDRSSALKTGPVTAVLKSPGARGMRKPRPVPDEPER